MRQYGFQNIFVTSHLVSTEAGLQVSAGQVADTHPLTCKIDFYLLIVLVLQLQRTVTQFVVDLSDLHEAQTLGRTEH